jgi:hypothetical protein
VLKRRDLCVHNNDIEKELRTAEILGIDEIGSEYSGTAHKNVIYRLHTRPAYVTTFPYLLVSEEIGQISSPGLDVFAIRDYPRVRSLLRKRVRRGLGLEIFIDDLRRAEGSAVGKWLEYIRQIYKLTKSTSCQLILSSGATSSREMIAARSFDTLLSLCNINPGVYWRELESWIEMKIGRKCYIDA